MAFLTFCNFYISANLILGQSTCRYLLLPYYIAIDSLENSCLKDNLRLPICFYYGFTSDICSSFENCFKNDARC
uniref:Uncharacterized protein n=1 Tax=Panagrolaimus sp. JU765 TaxID=591449 RepID=A0AC34QHC4_9BILA